MKVVALVRGVTGLAIAATVTLWILRERSTPKSPVVRAVQPEPRQVLEQVVLTRALAIEGPQGIAPQLHSMPQGVLSRDAQSELQRLTLWSLFFKGSLTKIAGMDSPTPIALFYNPLADVAVLDRCTYEGSAAANLATRPQCRELCALPGAALQRSPVGRSPEWLKEPDPLGALRQVTSARMRAFEQAFAPASTADAVVWRTRYCSERLQGEAEVRLMDLAATLAQVDAGRFTQAVAHYLADQAAVGHARGSSERALSLSTDPVLGLLTHLASLSFTGALRMPDTGWVVFLTPKQTGWKQAAVFLSSSQSNGELQLKGAQLLTLSSH